MAATEIPAPRPDDDEDVSWALSTAAALWGRGEREEALKWLRRAAEQASDADRDDRSLELVRAAADLSHAIGPARSTPPPKSVAPGPPPSASAAPPAPAASRPPPPPVPSRPPPVPSRPPPAPSVPPARAPERAAVPASAARPPVSAARPPASLPTPTPTTLPSRAAQQALEARPAPSSPVSAARPVASARAPVAAPPSAPREDDPLASTLRQDDPTQPGAPKKRLGTLLGNAPPPDGRAASTPRREVTLPGPLEDGRHKAKRRTASRPGKEPKTTELPAVPEARPAEPSTPPWDDLEEDGVTLMRTFDRRLLDPAPKAAAAPKAAPPPAAAPPSRPTRAAELPRMTDDLEEETNVLSGAHDDGLDDLTTVARRGSPAPAKTEKRAAASRTEPSPAAASVPTPAPPEPPPQAPPVERAPSLPAVRVAVLPGVVQGELRVIALAADLSPPPGAMLAVLVPMSEADGELVTRGLFGG